MRAITIGVFDGVHRGHQALLATARASGLPVTALTFDPHPAALLSPARTPKLLGTLAERTALLKAAGAERVEVIPFDPAFAALTPAAFIEQVLRPVQPEWIVVGDDFRFGCERRGDVETLRAAGLRVEAVPGVFVDGVPARSTVIRQMLSGGQVAEAARLLGRPYTLSGEVVHGRKLGRTIGYPTANLASDPRVLIPAPGVYAGQATLADGRVFRAAISIGTNPTVTENGPLTVEAFLLEGFDEDLYGQVLTLSFVHFLRGTVKFDGLDALLQQMAADVAWIESCPLAPVERGNEYES
ncbi:bifunctional riboflavin kinase/FAD synthetase [Armatimonas rosea]|uniref:Riboflavin biosynthesis protein n=1 Tax=Armatimonas rosea TaxID=685828 RepID=A0A7W9W8S8_ARMRO|nr:bifunctional riboflavin kinase/FAD synthetase [Armatimonas rosea]MBB6053058.1 riboflavin kinase/FMN adenylyltransferase [Armatimonas rosea]